MFIVIYLAIGTLVAVSEIYGTWHDEELQRLLVEAYGGNKFRRFFETAITYVFDPLIWPAILAHRAWIAYKISKKDEEL